jgi:hypothetical protein
VFQVGPWRVGVVGHVLDNFTPSQLSIAEGPCWRSAHAYIAANIIALPLASGASCGCANPVGFQNLRSA